MPASHLPFSAIGSVEWTAICSHGPNPRLCDRDIWLSPQNNSSKKQRINGAHFDAHRIMSFMCAPFTPFNRFKGLRLFFFFHAGNSDSFVAPFSFPQTLYSP